MRVAARYGRGRQSRLDVCLLILKSSAPWEKDPIIVPAPQSRLLSDADMGIPPFDPSKPYDVIRGNQSPAQTSPWPQTSPRKPTPAPQNPSADDRDVFFNPNSLNPAYRTNHP
jgi:hypothetical protein